MRGIRTAICLVALTLFCASSTPAQDSSEHSASSSQYEPQHKLLIIADNQEHLLTGVPLGANSSRTDRFVTSVARRSPLANVGGRLLFKEALRFGIREGAKLVLHLGDAADISCPDELSSVFAALDEEAKDIWFMVPGNHDGIQVGNYVEDQPSYRYDISKHPPVYTTPPFEKFTSVPEAWLNACLSPRNSKDPARADILTKGDAIGSYVAELKSRPGAKPEQLRSQKIRIKKTDVPVNCEIEKITIKSQGYTAVARICERTPVTTPATPATPWVGPYASFIVQRLDIGKTRIIMLDTSDYENPWVPYVAFTGDLSQDQIDWAESLFEKDKFDRKDVIVVGHHPLAVFRRNRRQTKKWIAKRAGRYISAHTHYSASKIKHRISGNETMELNVGSTLDHPPQAIVAYLGPTAMSFRVAGAKTGWAGFLAPCDTEENRNNWRRPLADLYTDYRRNLYAKHLKRLSLVCE